MPMVTLTPVDEFSEPVQVEANGTVITKEGIGDLGLQRLANQCTYLYNRLAGPRTIFCAPIPSASDGNFFDNDVPSDSALGVMLQHGAPGSDPIVKVFLQGLPIKGTIGEVRVNVFGSFASGVHGGLPASMPSFELWRLDPATGASVQVGTTITDASGSVPAYEAAHVLTLTGIAQAIEGLLFYLLIRGEDDGNALADSFAVMGIEVDVEAA